jgi:hypothetical protein
MGLLTRGSKMERMNTPLCHKQGHRIVPWHRSIEDRAMELVERELWRKRYSR